ncbi:MAG: PLP-dependent transferase, partial [Sedimentisphaerales bacterium]|nr:PLP-dependent transferase [Sedimentisphaerales bacterium]
MSHGVMSPDEKKKIGITEGTIRLSIGIEDAEDLISDLDRALDRI